MKMYFAAQCHNYQRRLCWMLSSIKEQTANPIDLQIEISCLKENGNPTTEKVVDEFKKLGLNISAFVYYKSQTQKFAKRGYVRTDQISRARKAGCEYIFFADSDNVYHPNFFLRLSEAMEKLPKDFAKCLSSIDKKHTDVNKTNAVIDAHAYADVYVRNAFSRASKIPTVVKGCKPIAGGAMQVCSIAAIDKLSEGVYVPAKESKDRHMLRDGQRARSDIQFRHRMQGSIIIDLPPQIHLNHVRDKELGKHLEIQR
jgi:GT2 family glycosyltransferase